MNTEIIKIAQKIFTLSVLKRLIFIYYININFIFADNLLEDEKNTISIFQRISPYVVNVNKLQKVIDSSFEMHEIASGSGTGFLWDTKGHVVTNFHVIANAGEIVVALEHGNTIKAEVVGTEPRRDIAVLKLDDPSVLKKLNIKTNLQVANSNHLQVGEKAIAIGNPFGLSKTITTGIVSALGRQVPSLIPGITMRNMIQTDASINPGNSGGPLLNSRGELIGMNTLIYSKTGTSSGIGFAVPSNEIKRVVSQIIKVGRVIQPGIGFYKLDDGIAYQLGINGVIIHQIIPDSPAAKAGLKGTFRDSNGRIQLGDIIIGIDGQEINDYDDLYQMLEKLNIGQKIIVEYIRHGIKNKVSIQLVDLTELDAQ